MRTFTVLLPWKDLRWMAAWLALAVGWGMAGPPPCRAGSARRTPVVEAVQRVQPSVVSITSEKKAASASRWPFSIEENQRPRVSGMGTGVILDGRGYILTNQHVVDKVQGIEVHLADGSIYPARLVQQDPVMDLAILRVTAGRPLPAIPIGSSADLMVGEPVITIGNAFGYENTTSVGIISALKRNVTLSDEQVYRNLIQTDAGINPGNSGGPLVNIDGELIGINVATRAGAQGIGFALPIDDVKRVAAEMLSTRRLAGTWHGLVAGERLDGDARRVLVAEVQPGSPAEATGVRPGDQVVRLGEWPVTTPLDIERALLDARPGQPVDLVVNRQGREQRLTLEVQPLPRSTPDPVEQVWRLVGLRITPVTPEYVSAVSPKLRGGLYVQAVLPNSPAARALIQKGDILVGMHVGNRHWETIRPDNILYILKQSEAAQAQAVQYYLVRHNAIQQGALDLADGASSPLTR
jgi:serine protease Do